MSNPKFIADAIVFLSFEALQAGAHITSDICGLTVMNEKEKKKVQCSVITHNAYCVSYQVNKNWHYDVVMAVNIIGKRTKDIPQDIPFRKYLASCVPWQLELGTNKEYIKAIKLRNLFFNRILYQAHNENFAKNTTPDYLASIATDEITTATVTVYRIDQDAEYQDSIACSFDEIKKNHEDVTSEGYVEVYSFQISTQRHFESHDDVSDFLNFICDKIAKNKRNPLDVPDVSDVIAIGVDNEKVAYYVDKFDYIPLPDFFE